jgi:S1-C subfamily serine protease
VTALGYPGSLDVAERPLQATAGTVSSAIGPATIGADLPRYPALIRHQAPISSGNSGGPLFDDRGEVVGVNTIGSTGEGGLQNQNAAISIDRARSLLPDLMADRDSGYVGWDLVPLDLFGGSLGVQGVDAGSPADQAGIEFGNVIKELDNTPVAVVSDVCDIINSKQPGDRLKVTDVRGSSVNVRLR